LECLNDPCGPGGRVDGDDFALGEGVCVDFVATMILGAVGGVIEQRDDLFVAILGEEPRVVLEAETDIGTQVKVRP
jgi:hypothetical protein